MCLFVYLAQDLTITNNLVKVRFCAIAAVALFANDLRPGQRAVYGIEQLLLVDRLLQQIDGPRTQSTYNRLRGCVTGDEYPPNSCILMAALFQKLGSRDARHTVVQNQQI